MKIYIRAYWYDDEESEEDFIYGLTSDSDNDSSDEPYEILDDDPYEDNVGYGDFADYNLYAYSEYEDFYKHILRRRIYVPVSVAKDIPDYNLYRKALFNTLFLSMKSGEYIDVLYDELCRTFPGMIKAGIINETDMLLEIVDATLYAQSVLNP